ncbi:MAG: sensor histidine kinase [Haloferacaceae archaeon]
MGSAEVGIDGDVIIDHIREPVFFIDERRRLAFGNERFFDVVQLSRDVLGEDEELLSEYLADDYEAFRETVEEVLVGGATDRRIDVTMHHPEGSPAPETLPAEARLVRVEDPPGVVVTLRNSSAHEEYERRLEKKSEQLLVLNRLLQHDIGNDVTVIEGWAELLAERADDSLQDLIDRIRGAAVHIQELTRETSGVLRLFEEDGGLERVPVPLVETLRAEVEKIRRTHPDAAITAPEPGSLGGVEVCANDLLGSVFTNVISNAVVHSDRETPRVDVTVERRGDTAVVRVADDGPGIPDEKKARLLSEDRTLGDEDAGIGTYLVTKLVNEFGGEVALSDNEPRGTVFTVALPVADGGCDGS